MQLYRDVVLDPYGNAVASASVAVLDAQGNLAPLIDAAGASQTNPLTTDALGSFAFAAANGVYTLRVTGSGLPSRELSAVILQDPAQLATTADLVQDLVATGLLPAVPAPVSLTMTTPTGVAYILGTRVAPAATAKTYPASQDTYVDLSAAGVYTYSAVANGGAAPAVAASSMRLFKTVTNATEVTGVTDLRQLLLITKPALLAALPNYPKASLPSAATYARALIYVPDEAGGAVPAFSDGTNWRRVTDRAVVS